jgi:hypothetical protein
MPDGDSICSLIESIDLSVVNDVISIVDTKGRCEE